MSERSLRYERRDICKHMYVWIERVVDELCSKEKQVVHSIDNETRYYEVDEQTKMYIIKKAKHLFDYMYTVMNMTSKDILAYAAASTSLSAKYILQELSCSLEIYSETFCNLLCSAEEIELAEYDILNKRDWKV